MKILTFTNYYLPGWKAGGSTRAVANAVAQLHGEHEFFIVTLDRDEADIAPYPGAHVFAWQDRVDCRMCYVPTRGPRSIMRAIRDVQPDLVWLNSYFSPFTTWYLLLRRLGVAYPRIPVLLAPRGEVSARTLALKPTKKKLYRVLSRVAGIYRKVKYQATSEQEFQDIAQLAHPHDIHLAPDLLPPPIARQTAASLTKHPGELKLAFISRIDHKKNLAFLLQVMAQMQDASAITLDIYGPVNAPAYWAECQAIMARLPPGKVQYRGALAHHQVPAALAAAHFFVLPTLDENFGYAIAESWQAARPAIISEGTPWRNLAEQQLGYDLALNVHLWASTLRACIAMDNARWQDLCRCAEEYYARLATASPEPAKTAAMFAAVACTRPPG